MYSENDGNVCVKRNNLLWRKVVIIKYSKENNVWKWRRREREMKKWREERRRRRNEERNEKKKRRKKMAINENILSIQYY